MLSRSHAMSCRDIEESAAAQSYPLFDGTYKALGAEGWRLTVGVISVIFVITRAFMGASAFGAIDAVGIEASKVGHENDLCDSPYRFSVPKDGEEVYERV